MLNLEITDNFKKRRFLISSLYIVTHNIENNLPGYICHKFFKTQDRALFKLFMQERDRLYKKLKFMQSFKRNNDNNTKKH